MTYNHKSLDATSSLDAAARSMPALIPTLRRSAGVLPGMRRCLSQTARLACWLAHGFILMSAQAWAQQRITFVSVDPDDPYRQADAKLVALLQTASQQTLDPRPSQTYGTAIRTVAEWKKEGNPYIARLTPYACVAAEMLGAQFDILATYQSLATQSRTYHSYFVINREKYRATMQRELGPNLTELREYLAHLGSTSLPRFVYHDKFSTSSYFLPSLYFRAQRIFSMARPTENLIAINVRKLEKESSSALVEEVAQGAADIAAVWDGTKGIYEKPPLKDQFGSRVYFVQLPTALPNDLLVASTSLDHKITERIHTAISQMKSTPSMQIKVGDFAWWEDIREASDAREALAGLRREAAAPPAPVPVRVEESNEPLLQNYIEAAREAVRLSGTELVLFDPDFHKQFDLVWSLRLMHDGAISLKNDVQNSHLPAQEFTISFTSMEDLTVRIGALIHSRLHRIRYIWPYEERTPTVIRDVDFAVLPGTRLEVQKIRWVDPAKNQLEGGDIFEAGVKTSDYHKFELEGAFARLADQTAFDFQPMSNTAYRVVLVRPSRERLWLKALTVGFVVLLMLAAIATIVVLSRRKTPLAGARSVPNKTMTA